MILMIMKCQLFGVLALAALSLLVSIKPVASQTCGSAEATQVDVLILGAGMAGISTAKTLSDNGITNFIILEAQDVIGGRVRSTELSPGVTIEEGANWIQGVDQLQENEHPLFQLAASCGGLDGFHSDYDSLTVYNSTGEDISNDAILRYDDYTNASDAAVNDGLDRQDRGLPDISVREGLTSNGWTPITPEDEWLDWYSFDFCFAETPDIVSLYSLPLPTYVDFGNPDNTGDFFVTDQDGFDSLVDCLATGFLEENDERLLLETMVTTIRWSDDCVCVTATTNDGNREYCGKYAITTFSIGVLQTVTFDPPLLQSKRDVIDMFSMTNFLRIFLQFNETFWNSDATEYIGFVSNTTRGYYSAFQPLNRYLPGNASVLVFTVTENEADRISQQSPQATIDEIREVLGIIYQREIPEPLNFIISDWDTNPLFLGSFPSTPLNFSQAVVDDLAAPVGRLYFSGEATSIHNTYVHGAYLSGIESANAVTAAIESSADKMTMNFILLVILLITAAVIVA